MNPYASSTLAEKQSSLTQGVGDHFGWKNHVFDVSSAMVPSWLPCLQQFWISVDGGESQTLLQFRFCDRIDFELTTDRGTKSGTFRTAGFGICEVPFQILVSGESVVVGKVTVKNGRLGFCLGVLVGLCMSLIPIGLLVMGLWWTDNLGVAPE